MNDTTKKENQQDNDRKGIILFDETAIMHPEGNVVYSVIPTFLDAKTKEPILDISKNQMDEIMRIVVKNFPLGHYMEETQAKVLIELQLFGHKFNLEISSIDGTSQEYSYLERDPYIWLMNYFIPNINNYTLNLKAIEEIERDFFSPYVDYYYNLQPYFLQQKDVPTNN